MNCFERTALWTTLLLAYLIVPPSNATGQTVHAVSTLDLTRYHGEWYKVAHLPIKSEKHCVGDTVILYAARYKPGQFQVVTTCKTKQGLSDVRDMNGRRADKGGDGKLKVTTIWPFSTQEWVLALGNNYEWALVGSPNHKLLWILSRTPALEPEVLAGIKATAAAQGYDTGRLVAIPQQANLPQQAALP